MSDEQRSSTPHTNQQFYDRISRVYDAIADASEHRAREAGQLALAVTPGERILEIGFGTGNSLVDFARQVGAAGRVCGIDVSPGMLEVARRKIEAAGLSAGVDLLLADARDLPYQDGSFDAVFMSFTLELFDDEEIRRVLGQARRVLAGGGRIGVVGLATVMEHEHESLIERAYRWMHRHFPHIVDCRPIDVSAVVCAAAFEVVKETRMEIWTLPVATVIGRKAR